ncbi:MAG TPA: CPBP family intramembrane glutamic endopeptidase, partial [Usitatibacter sp.]|nr:CPBP family intramembrane glutamic endopeptidase [Usitatibacter sp.]
PDLQVTSSFTASGLVILFLSSTIGPVIEEIAFRGFIYRAFERQWGWVASLIATSALFGIYHPHFWNAFTGSVILVCIYRRAGSLRAPILVHMLYNLLTWPPLLGQYVFPRAATLTDPSSWIVQGTCLAIAVIAVPAYVYMSRDRRVAPTLFLEPNGALQK